MKGLSNEFIEAIGWTLVHALWQATAVAVLLALVMFFTRKKSAQIRYFISFVALIGVFAWSAVTFSKSLQYANQKKVVKEQLASNPDYLKTLLVRVADTQPNEITTQATTHSIAFNQLRLRAFFQRHFNIICVGWLIGMVILTLRLVFSFWYNRRLRTYMLIPVADELQQKLNELVRRMGLTQKVEAFFSPLAKVPITLGVIKPVILFPISAVTGLSAKQIEAVIAHELAHIIRHDYLFNILQTLVETLFFFHPAVWIISAQIRAERENSCDNMAIRLTGDKLTYVRTLATIEVARNSGDHYAMAFAGRKGTVLNRIQRLQNEIAMKTNFFEGFIAAGIIVGGLLFASFTSGGQSSNPAVEPSLNSAYSNEQSMLNKPDRDSVFVVLEEKLKNKNISEDEAETIRQSVEIAMSETNGQLSDEIVIEINRAMQEVDVARIVREAMQEVSVAMREASVEVKRAKSEVDTEEIRRDMQEARRDIELARKEVERDMRRDMKAEGIDQATIDAAVAAATAGLDIASAVVNSINVEGIVSAALNGVSAALNAVGQIQFDTLELESPMAPDPNDQAARTRQLEQEKKKLQQEQKKLERKLKELEAQLDKEK